jgi:anti-anti-sigma factor
MSAPAIQRYLDALLEREPISGLVFDLTRAETLDSTNLGLLARINARAQSKGGPESMIVSKNEDINDVLHSMGFDQVFAIVTEVQATSDAGSDSIDTPTPTQEELRSTMLEAHRALMSLSEAGCQQFRDVVACLESDCAR